MSNREAASLADWARANAIEAARAPLDGLTALLPELRLLRDEGHQPMHNGRPSCPFCDMFIDDEETHAPDCPLVAALRDAPEETP